MEIHNYLRLDFPTSVKVWEITSGYLINTKASSKLALRVISNGDCPDLSSKDKEILNSLLEIELA